MNRTTVVLYARTSTDEQVNGMDAQVERLTRYADDHGWPLGQVARVETEHASGKSLARRPILQNVLTRMDKAGSDGVLVVTKLDRLARSTLDFASIIRRAERKGWQLVVLDLGLDMTTPMGRFAANVAAAVAELERALIADRTRDGLAVVKARGTTKTGKPAVFGHPSRVPTDVRARIVRDRDAGMSWRAVADGLNRDRIASPGASSPAGHNRTSTRWHANAARRIHELTTKERAS